MLDNQKDERFKEVVSSSILKNFPVEFKDGSNSYSIFGANCNRLRGVSARQKPKSVKEKYMKIPKDFYLIDYF